MDDLASRRDALVESRLNAARYQRGAPSEVAVDLLRDWDTLSVPLRRDALRSLIKQIVITPGRPRASVLIEPA